jgi:parallel beta-helix repeat protein
VDIRAGGSTVRGCIFKNWQPFSMSSDAFSMLQFTGATHTIDSCVFNGYYVGGYAEQNGITAIACLARASAVNLKNSTFTNCYQGIRFRNGTGNVVEYNSFTECGDGADAGISAGEKITRITYRYNIAKDPLHGGFRIAQAGNTAIMHHNLVYWTKDNVSGSTGAVWGFIVDPGATAEMYHNVAAFSTRAVSRTGKAGFLVQNSAAGTTIIKDNISMGNGVGYSSGSYTPTLDFDYNCAYNNKTSNYYGSFKPGAHDVITDPKFVSTKVNAEDFHFTVDSPCIKAGLNISGISITYPTDIGRYG